MNGPSVAFHVAVVLLLVPGTVWLRKKNFAKKRIAKTLSSVGSTLVLRYSHIITKYALAFFQKLMFDFNLQWKMWSAWTECSKSCGGGTMSRKRECDGGNISLKFPPSLPNNRP